MQFRHVYMNFRKNFSQKKKNISPFQKNTLAETVNCIPKGLRKGNPFHGPFAQLSYIYIRGVYMYTSYSIWSSRSILEKYPTTLSKWLVVVHSTSNTTIPLLYANTKIVYIYIMNMVYINHNKSVHI